MNMSNDSQQAPGAWQNFKEYLRNFTMFPSTLPSTDAYERRTQRISTALFILLFISSMTIILVYILPQRLISTKTKIVQIQAATLLQYSQLSATVPETLLCPCAKGSISYKKFIHVEYSLHQVCSSIFVNQSWIDYLRAYYDTPISSNDFRWTGSSAFQALSTLCQLINRTISDSLDQFYSNQYVSTTVVSQQLLESEIESSITHFRSRMTNSFSLSLSMIRDITQANALLSGLRTNYYSYVTEDQHVSTVANTYSGCNCMLSPRCVTTASIYLSLNSVSLLDIPGFYTGCYVIEALLQSNLECFYSQQCIDQLQSYIWSFPLVKAIALDASSSSMYSINASINELVDNLMIEEWKVSMMFDRYYDECHPLHCTYTYIADTDDTVDIGILYIVIILLAIIGGLNTVIRCVVPLLVRPTMHCFRKQRPNVIRDISTVHT